MAQLDPLSVLAFMERAPAPVRMAANEALRSINVHVAVRAANQALGVSGVEAKVAQQGAVDARRAREEIESRLGFIGRVLAPQRVEHSTLWVEAVPKLLARISDADSTTAIRRASLELAELLSFEGAVPFLTDNAWTDFLEDPDAGLRFESAEPVPSTDPVTPHGVALDSMGTRITPPVSREHHGRLLHETSDPALLATSPFSGMHVSISRSLPYMHHGVLVGDGTVVHFVGKKVQKPGAAIRRTPLSRFLRADQVPEVTQRFPKRQGHGPVPTFLPNLVVLRALHFVGSGNYNLFGRNCEHFATWAQCGAMLSGQVDQVWRDRQHRLANMHGDLAAAAMESYLAAWTITVGSAPLGLVPPSSDVSDDPVLLDIGRVRWCRDMQSLLWYLPLWCSADPSRLWETPFGPHDRPWTTDPRSEQRAWHTTAPSIRLSRAWHAALLAEPDGSVYTLECDGTWRLANIDLHSIIDERASAIQALNSALAQRWGVFEHSEADTVRSQTPNPPKIGPGPTDSGE